MKQPLFGLYTYQRALDVHVFFSFLFLLYPYDSKLSAFKVETKFVTNLLLETHKVIVTSYFFAQLYQRNIIFLKIGSFFVFLIYDFDFQFTELSYLDSFQQKLAIRLPSLFKTQKLIPHKLIKKVNMVCHHPLQFIFRKEKRSSSSAYKLISSYLKLDRQSPKPSIPTKQQE